VTVNRKKLVILTIAASAALNAVLLWHAFDSTPARADITAQGEELSVYMGRLQRHTHKLGLSIDAGNQELAKFYMTEIGETVDMITKRFPDYNKLQIAALTTAMLAPFTGPLKTAVETNFAGASAAYDKFIAGCNGCHAATQRQYVKITRSKTNPYPQDFSK
jgi:hypothetical protein